MLNDFFTNRKVKMPLQSASITQFLGPFTHFFFFGNTLKLRWTLVDQHERFTFSFDGLFVPRTNSYFAPYLDKTTSLLNKFLVRNEITSYNWNEINMERNDRIPHERMDAFILSLSLTFIHRVATIFSANHWLSKNITILFSMSSQGKTLIKRILLFLVYGFAGAGVFTILEKREETNKEKAMRMLQQLKKNLTIHHNITDEEFERFAVAAYKAIRVNKTLDWSYFRAVDFTYSALTTIGEFPFYMIKSEHSHG